MTTVEAYASTTSATMRTNTHTRARWYASAPQATVLLTDWISATVAAGAALLGRFGFGYFRDATPEVPTWLVFLLPLLWLVALAIFGGYATQHLQAGAVENQRVLLATLLFAGATGVTCYLLQYDLSRGFFVLLFATGLSLMLTLRLIRRRLLRRLRAKGFLQSPVILAGSPTHIDEVDRVLAREPWLGYRVIGAVTPARIEQTPGGVKVLSSVGGVVDLVKKADVHAVIFAEGSFPDSQHFKRMAWEMEEQDTHMIVVPGVTDICASRLKPRPVGGLPLVHVDRPQALAAARWSKRLFDIVGSTLLILASAPIVAVVALLIKMEDGGPIFFKQVRVGRAGERFDCYKIRSMVVDAEARKQALQNQNEGAGVLFKMARDPRITRVGGVIRRFSIDELPQFWNVLRGDMSLVGPRPNLPSEVAQYDRDAERRLDVRPGLTGLWQVSGRSDLSWDESIRLDTYYVDNWSLLEDISIMMRTARAVFGSRGAY